VVTKEEATLSFSRKNSSRTRWVSERMISRGSLEARDGHQRRSNTKFFQEEFLEDEMDLGEDDK